MRDSSLIYDFMPPYFSIHDILSSQTKVPSKFLVSCSNLGYIDPASNSQHLNKDSKLELPYWLANPLCNSRKIVSVSLPKAYTESYREVLNADATVVDLHKVGPYFYSFGNLLGSFQHIEIQEVFEIIQQVFRDRFKKILEYSLNASYREHCNFLKNLDETERQLLALGQQISFDQENWIHSHTNKISASQIIENQRKREQDYSKS